MEILIKKQTSWGCIRCLKVYKNGIYQGILVNNLSRKVEISIGDTLELKEGFFAFSRKIRISDPIEEISISTIKSIKSLFITILLLFLVSLFFIFFIHSFPLFFFIEAGIAIILNRFFRRYSYQLTISQKKINHLLSYSLQ